MATSIYKENKIRLIDGRELKVSPLKIKYLREFMDCFDLSTKAKDDDEIIAILVECCRIAMQQFMPELSVSSDEIENNLDLPTVYELVEYASGIKIKGDAEESVKDQAQTSESGTTWNDLDLAKLEAELFLIGSWRNYDELESTISMTEMLETLSAKRDLDYQEKKFLAAIQGVDIDKDKGEDAWEAMKKRVFNKGKDSNDITLLKGRAAQQAGFGIGMGLDFEEVTA